MSTVYFSLGTNKGRRLMNLRRAVKLIGERVGEVEAKSTVIETEPWGFESKNKFLNAAIRVNTSLTPRQVLETTQQIEREMGRTQKSVNKEYHDRIIDIDILLYDDITIDEPDLKIPHPLMQERDFVMTPLREVAKSEILQ